VRSSSSSSANVFASSARSARSSSRSTTTMMMTPSTKQQQEQRRSKNVSVVALKTTRNETRSSKRGSAVQTSALSVDVLSSSSTEAAASAGAALSDISALEGNIQGFYLGTLLLILGFSGFIVVRQVLIRRELDDQAKKTGERIRAGNATSDDYFEMGSIMLRKKVYTQAIRNLQLAAENWEGDEEDLAQVHNALGFGYAEMEKYEEAIKEFKLASQLQPGYVTVWNNLGDAYEKLKMQKEAVKCYEEALVLAPGNSVATMRLKNMRERAERLGLTIE